MAKQKKKKPLQRTTEIIFEIEHPEIPPVNKTEETNKMIRRAKILYEEVLDAIIKCSQLKSYPHQYTSLKLCQVKGLLKVYEEIFKNKNFTPKFTQDTEDHIDREILKFINNSK